MVLQVYTIGFCASQPTHFSPELLKQHNDHESEDYDEDDDDSYDSRGPYDKYDEEKYSDQRRQSRQQIRPHHQQQQQQHQSREQQQWQNKQLHVTFEGDEAHKGRRTSVYEAYSDEGDVESPRGRRKRETKKDITRTNSPEGRAGSRTVASKGKPISALKRVSAKSTIRGKPGSEVPGCDIDISSDPGSLTTSETKGSGRRIPLWLLICLIVLLIVLATLCGGVIGALYLDQESVIFWGEEGKSGLGTVNELNITLVSAQDAPTDNTSFDIELGDEVTARSGTFTANSPLMVSNDTVSSASTDIATEIFAETVPNHTFIADNIESSVITLAPATVSSQPVSLPVVYIVETDESILSPTVAATLTTTDIINTAATTLSPKVVMEETCGRSGQPVCP